MAMGNLQNKESKKSPKKKDRTALKSGIIIVILVALVIGYYYYLSNKEKQRQEEVIELTVAQELLAKNLETNYPPTPKEVIKYYSELTKCFYNEEYTDEELEKLAAQARLLYDEDLLAYNDWSHQLIELKEDIDYYKTNEIQINNYTIPASTDVEYFSEDGYQFARLYCTYYLVTKNVTQTVNEVYLLRKDEQEHWKIYGWDLAENVSLEEE